MHTLIILGAKYLYLLIVLLAAISFWQVPSEKRKTTAIFAVIDLIIVYIAGWIAGKLYVNPRPFVSEHITPLIIHSADNGFPSDHVIFTAALSSIVFSYNRKLGTVMFILTVLVGASRVAAGIHHWADVVGAIAIAVIVSYIVYAFIQKKAHAVR